MESQDGNSKESRKFDFIFVHPHLKFGGAEKHSVLVANAMVERGHSVAFFLHSKTGGLLQQLDSRVKVYGSISDHHLAIFLVSIHLFRFLKSVERTEVIVRLWSSAMAMGLIQKRIDHNIHFYEDLDPREHAKYISFGKLKQRVIKVIYTNAKSLIANANTTALSMREVYGLKRTPKVIYPCVDVETAFNLAYTKSIRDKRTKNTTKVVSVGSLVPLKGFKKVASELGISGLSISWTVIGDGPLRKELETFCRTFPNLQVDFVGTVQNPLSIMSECQHLVHGAESESFGLVIIEALSLGLSVISTESAGPKEILEIGKGEFNLTVVSRTDGAMADALRNLASRRLVSLTPKAKELLSRFSTKSNVEEWEKLRASS